MKDGVSIKGFYRVHLTEDRDGKEVIVGDSGWHQNVLTNLGIQNYLAYLLAASAGSKQIGFIAIGTGAAPATDAVVLAGEIMASTHRKAVSLAFSARTASNGSATMQFTATFASSDSFLTGASNISNIGLFAATTTNDTLFAGNTYASSACATNQNVNVTYQIQLG